MPLDFTEFTQSGIEKHPFDFPWRRYCGARTAISNLKNGYHMITVSISPLQKSCGIQTYDGLKFCEEEVFNLYHFLTGEADINFANPRGRTPLHVEFPTCLTVKGLKLAEPPDPNVQPPNSISILPCVSIF